MMRAVGLGTIAVVTTACAQTDVRATVFDCTASQSCRNGACAPSDLEFMLTPTPPDMSIAFVDGTEELAFVETTFATVSSGPIVLNTYQSGDRTIRVTLADDMTATPRVRLELTANGQTRSIAGQCSARRVVSQ